jgi:glutathione S-transferase
MSLTLCYTALSPFCRKVRMAMEYKGLVFDLAPGDNVRETPAYNPRAEVPILVDDELVVVNSPDILAYLDRKYPERPLYPQRADRYAEVREWERIADTVIDPIMTVIGNWMFANLPAMPAGLHESAERDINQVYDQLQARLAGRDYIADEISAADFALYPQIGSGRALNLPLDAQRHPDFHAWLKRMRARPEGQSDLAAAREWWANRANQSVDVERVNWGTFRLEWLLANGQSDWFADQVRADKVLWSVGPKANAHNHPRFAASVVGPVRS